MDRYLFATDELNTLYENINTLFSPFDNSKNNKNSVDLSSGQISDINNILRTLDNRNCFKDNSIIQLCFYDLVYSKISNIKEYVVSNIFDEKRKNKISSIVEEWFKIINPKRELLQKIVMKNYYDTFGDKLSKLLKYKKITKTDFAELLGLSRTTVSDYCNKKSFPDNFYKLLQISNLLGCNIQYLIDYDTELPDATLQAIYKDIGLTGASISKLKDIMYMDKALGLMGVLNILIEYIDVDTVSEYDVLSSVALYLNKYPYNDKKYLIGENLINEYKEEFKNISTVEEAQSKFNGFIRDLKFDSIDTKSFERKDVLYLSDIQEKLILIKKELHKIDEPEKFFTNEVLNKFKTPLKK